MSMISSTDKTTRRKYLTLAGTTAGISLAGCMGNGDGDRFVTVGTGSTGGVYFPLGGGIADLLNDLDGINATAESTGGSVENVRLVADGEIDIGMAFGNVALDAVEGEGDFDNPQPIAAAFGMYFSHTQVVLPTETDIETIDDLSGMSVGVGAPGSGTETVTEEILNWYGLDYDDIDEQRLDFSETADALRDDVIDAGFINSAVPTAAIDELTAIGDYSVYSFPEDDIAAIDEEFEFFGRAELPAGTYEGQEDAVINPGISNVVFVAEDEDEDFVYDAVESVFENIDQMIEVHPAAEEFENAATQSPIEFHVGAEQYLNDAGL